MRLITLFVGVLAGYAAAVALGWHIALRRRFGFEAQYWIAVTLGVGLMAVLALQSAQDALSWAVFWRRDWFERWPIDAAVAGFVTGVVLGDSRRALFRPKQAGASQQTSALPSVFMGIATLAMLVLGAVPPRTWSELFNRTESVSASATGGVSIAFTPAEARNVGQAVQALARPPTLASQVRTTEVGFALPCLVILQDLVAPPANFLSRDEPLRISDLFNRFNAERVLFGSRDQSVAGDASDLQVNLIARDRAMFWMLHDERDEARSARLRQQISDYARTQEVFLRSMRRHVSCLEALVIATADQKIIEYRNYQIVEHLTAIARSLMDLEYDEVRRQTANRSEGRASSTTVPLLLQDARRRLVKDVNDRYELLQQRLTTFANEAKRILELRSTGSGDQEAFRKCEEATTSEHHTAIISLSSDRYRGMFSPYIQIFAAYLMSAIGDHAAAVKLLATWVDRLNAVESFLLDEEKRYYRQMIAWMRLRALLEVYLIQRYSEGSELQVPVRIEFLRTLAFQVYPNAVPIARKDIWFRDGKGACHAETERWLQNFVMSRHTFLKDYLDFVVSDDALSGDLNSEDLRVAESLVDLDLDCFPVLLGDPVARVRQRAQFTSTFAITVISASQRMTRGDRDLVRLIEKAKLQVREAIALLDTIGDVNDTGTTLGPTERLVYSGQGIRLRTTMQRVKEALESLDGGRHTGR